MSRHERVDRENVELAVFERRLQRVRDGRRDDHARFRLPCEHDLDFATVEEQTVLNIA